MWSPKPRIETHLVMEDSEQIVLATEAPKSTMRRESDMKMTIIVIQMLWDMFINLSFQ